MRKLMDGEMTAEEFATEELRVTEALMKRPDAINRRPSCRGIPAARDAADERRLAVIR